MEIPVLKARVESLLSGEIEVDELFYGTLTVLSAVYGPESHQVKVLLESSQNMPRVKQLAAQGALKNLKAELDVGLAGSLQQRLSAEVLTDFIQLARAVLDREGEDAKNVAAVLAAAAFEDTIRRMGVKMAGAMGGGDLSEVIDALKNKGVLVSPQVGIAQSYLNFRNRALHANWAQIDRSAVHSVLGFVEQLLLKYFQ